MISDSSMITHMATANSISFYIHRKEREKESQTLAFCLKIESRVPLISVPNMEYMYKLSRLVQTGLETVMA